MRTLSQFCTIFSPEERRERDSNPRTFWVNGFQDRRIRPLCHLSAAKITVEHLAKKLWARNNIFFEKPQSLGELSGKKITAKFSQRSAKICEQPPVSSSEFYKVFSELYNYCYNCSIIIE